MINLSSSTRPNLSEEDNDEIEAPEIGATKDEFLKFMLIPKEEPPAPPPNSHYSPGYQDKTETEPEEEEEEEEIKKEFNKKDYQATAATIVSFIDKIVPLSAGLIMGKPSQIYKADPEGYNRLKTAAFDYAESLKIKLKPGQRFTFVFIETYSTAFIDVGFKGLKWAYSLIIKYTKKPSWSKGSEAESFFSNYGQEEPVNNSSENNSQEPVIMEECASCGHLFDRSKMRKYHIKAIGEDKYFCDSGHYQSYMNKNKFAGKHKSSNDGN